MKKLTLFLIAIMTCLGVSAQNVSVSGTVVSAADGEPLIGASVMEGFLYRNCHRH